MRGVRHALGVRPVYKTVDTCAAEFPALTPYHYSSYDEETEVAPRERPEVVILGSGPNRIGQGVEFDYSCVHASVRAARRRLRDGDGQLQPRDRLDRLRHERPAVLRAAHPRGRARGAARRGAVRADRSASSASSAGRPRSGSRKALKDAGVPILGTSARGHRPRRGARRCSAGSSTTPGLLAPAARHRVRARAEAVEVAEEIGYPVLVRPSYVLGGRGMEIVYDDADACATTSTRADRSSRPDHPLLVDRFLDDAIEIDVDALYDGTELYIGGVMEHIEEAGIHSGDSALHAAAGHARRAPRSTGCARRRSSIAQGVGVRGLLNVQFAIGAGRALRARGEPAGEPHGAVRRRRRSASRWPRPRRGSWSARRSPSCAPRACCPRTATAARCRWTRRSRSRRPCCRSSGSAPRRGSVVDSVLGPEMRSTGEVMGIDRDFAAAFAKSQSAALRRAAAPGHGVRLGRRPRQAGR